MKKVTLVLLCAVLMSISAIAQSIDATKVPNPVKKSHMTKYPKATELEWELESTFYNAMFMNGNNWTIAKYSATGTWEKSDVTIDPENLPSGLAKKVASDSKGYQVSSVNRTDSPKSLPMYELILDNEDGKTITAIYKADGTLVSKKETEVDQYEEEDEEEDDDDI